MYAYTLNVHKTDAIVRCKYIPMHCVWQSYTVVWYGMRCVFVYILHSIMYMCASFIHAMLIQTDDV